MGAAFRYAPANTTVEPETASTTNPDLGADEEEAAAGAGDHDHDHDHDEARFLASGGVRKGSAAYQGDKKRTLQRRMSRWRVCRERADLCCRLTFVVLIVLLFVFAVMTFILAEERNSNAITNVTVLMSLPSAIEWKNHKACVASTACALCDLPVMLSMQPQRSRVALFAARGAGGIVFRKYAEAATRLRTTSDVCDVTRNAYFNPAFLTSCAEPFTFAHSVMTQFSSVARMADADDYVPTHAILFVRDPFDTAKFAFHITKRCPSAVNDLTCPGAEMRAGDFETQEWVDFALESARAQIEAWAAFDAISSTASSPQKLVLHYEDLLQEPMTLFTRFFDFIPGLLANPQRGTACAARFSDASLTTRDTVPEDLAFPAPLLAKMCAILKPRWDAKRWGTERCSSSSSSP